MAQVDEHLSTGVPGLDRTLRGLIPGDNIVWQVESVDDYRPFLGPLCDSARKLGFTPNYFRFAKHPPLIDDDSGVQIHRLNPEEGFETFLADMHEIIGSAGHGGFYIFDCLSDLAVDWYSDQMLGNFFMLTCPYLLDMEAIAYFGLLRNRHSMHATSAISETTQVLLDVYRHREKLYVHPWKVQSRYSPTMHMLHVWEGEQMHPITESATISEIKTSVPWGRLESSSQELGIWNRRRMQAQEVLHDEKRGLADPAEKAECFHHLIRMAITRDERMLELIEEYFTLEDVLDIERRMIGTGLVGGKSVGMLLARAILRRDHQDLAGRIEPHDSFYVASDVFYTFLVRNGIWWVREKQKDRKRFLEGSGRARHRILTGTFPEHIQKQFEDMLDYFGQSPIIVRSSSLLEDNFGNAFAGKYESVFCANQGPRYRRLDDFLSAVRTIYASTMSEKALSYRARRNLLEHDEQMALLVQRVSGAAHTESSFFPQVAGVGFSLNPYVWDEGIDPKAGALRLVFGLGTHAVDRADDDYTRVVALNDPAKRPERNFDEVRQYSQRRVDLINLQANQVVSTPFSTVVKSSPSLPIEWLASRDEETARRAAAAGIQDAFPWVLTFDRLFSESDYVQDMRDLLATLHKAYEYPVDVEFTTNLSGNSGEYKINVVQCRPLQVKEGGSIVDPPADLASEDIVLDAHGAVIGQGRTFPVDTFIYVTPSSYGQLTIADRHTVARIIGRLTHLDALRDRTILLAGPGRWCTSSPELGVPTRFSDINTVSAICEIVAMREDLIPDVSLGTHFFSDLVEMEMLYFALFPHRSENVLNDPFLTEAPNQLGDLLPGDAAWSRTVRVIDTAALPGGKTMHLNANPLKQRVVGYVGDEPERK